MKKYVKPLTESIRLEENIEILEMSNCICHGHCTCDHNSNPHQGPSGNQPICTCKNRPKMMMPQEEPILDWPE